jgi:hypothetical protein
MLLIWKPSSVRDQMFPLVNLGSANKSQRRVRRLRWSARTSGFYGIPGRATAGSHGGAVELFADRDEVGQCLLCWRPPRGHLPRRNHKLRELPWQRENDSTRARA